MSSETENELPDKSMKEKATMNDEGIISEATVSAAPQPKNSLFGGRSKDTPASHNSIEDKAVEASRAGSFRRLTSLETHDSHKTHQSVTHISANPSEGGARAVAVKKNTNNEEPKAAYERINSLESRDTRDSIGWLTNVVDTGLKDKDPRDYGNTMTIEDIDHVGGEVLGEKAKDKPTNVTSTEPENDGTQSEQDNVDAKKQSSSSGTDMVPKTKKKRKRSITLDAAIDAQNHKNILLKNKSYEYAKLAHNKFNMLYEKNENFFDIVGRRIPIVMDAWRTKNSGSTPSSLIQCWANEYCARDTPGPWSTATEPTLRTDIYDSKYTVENCEHKVDEEERLKLFRELSSRHVMKLSENYKSGFSNAIPGRVYMKNCAEWTPNCQLYTKSEFMRKEDAARCGIGYILALPIQEISKNHQPVCVLEISRLGPKTSTDPDMKLHLAMANNSILQDVQMLNEILKPLGLVAPVVSHDLFGYNFEKLCPPPKAESEGEASTVSMTLPQCPLTASVMRPDEKEVMANIVKRAVANGDVEFAQFWYLVTKRKGSLVTSGMPYDMNEYHKADTDETRAALPWYVKEPLTHSDDLGLQPYSRLTAYRISCEERALPLLTGGPVGAAYNAFKTTSKAKIIYWPDVQNATSSKFVMSHICASLKVEAVAAVVIPNLLLDTSKQRLNGDVPTGNVILELVLPSNRSREQHRKSISNVVNMASCEGKQLQLSWKQKELAEQQNALAQLKKHLDDNQ